MTSSICHTTCSQAQPLLVESFNQVGFPPMTLLCTCAISLGQGSSQLDSSSSFGRMTISCSQDTSMHNTCAQADSHVQDQCTFRMCDIKLLAFHYTMCPWMCTYSTKIFFFYLRWWTGYSRMHSWLYKACLQYWHQSCKAQMVSAWGTYALLRSRLLCRCVPYPLQF